MKPLTLLLWMSYLGLSIWANGSNSASLPGAAISTFNLWAGPLIAGLAVGGVSGFAFVWKFSTSHGGIPIIANGMPIGIAAATLTLTLVAVLNYMLHGNHPAIVLVAPVLSVGFPVMALMLRHG